MTSVQEKIRLLEKLLEKSKDVQIENSEDPEFISWKNLVERTFVRVYGKDSTEMSHFSDLEFYFPAMVFSLGSDTDYTQQHLRYFRQSFTTLTKSIKDYIEELKEQEPTKTAIATENTPIEISKVFISHASADSKIVEEVIELLETFGLTSSQIFCTSFDGYGIPLGENFLEAIKTELSSETLVIFVLTENFYKSPVCLCEMGAAWVLSKEHFPIVVPPFDYNNIKGVIPLTQGFKITEPLKLNLFKEKIESVFNIPPLTSGSTWERKRDRISLRIQDIVEKM